MYYKLPIKERMELMKSYRKANPDMSYRDMVNDYNTSYEKFKGGGEFNDYVQPGPLAKQSENDNSGMIGLMKSKIATEAHYGNPAALRMVSPNPKTGMTPEGIGTHYMASMGEYAVPLLQDRGGKNLEYNENPPISKENIRFNSPKEAEYFAEHYKEVAPMMRNYQEYKYGGIQKFGDGGIKERDPIYVTDKNDPRLRAYNDSLNLHIQGLKEAQTLNKTNNYKDWNTYFNTLKNKEYYDRLVQLNNKKPEFTIFSKTFKDDWSGSDIGSVKLYKKPIQPIVYHDLNKKSKDTAQYKKSVQPHVYKKPEEVLPQVTPQIVPQIPTQNIKPVIQDTVKYQPVVDNGLTRRWNFNTSNPTLEYYDKSGKLIKSEYYKNMNDFKQGKQINYK